MGGGEQGVGGVGGLTNACFSHECLVYLQSHCVQGVFLFLWNNLHEHHSSYSDLLSDYKAWV